MKIRNCLLVCLFFFIPSFVLLIQATDAPAKPAEAKKTQKDSAEASAKDTAKTETEKPQITEEVVVTAKTPKEMPISSTSLIMPEALTTIAPRDLSQLLSYAPGTFVSGGAKAETGIRIRGMDTGKVTLMYDGIPLAEPYFNSFNLNTVPTAGLAAVRVVKGASSVLYGANALGGVVDVTSKRPESNTLSLYGQFGSFGMADVAATGSVRGSKVAASGAFSFDRSDAYQWKNGDDHSKRMLSDYERKDVTGKFYYYPSANSELLAEFDYYKSNFGVPPATQYSSARYWRFTDWERQLASVGGTFGLSNGGYVKVKGYYVRYYNVLDAFKTAAMDKLQWISTYRNWTGGAVVAGSMPVAHGNEIQYNLNYRHDDVNTQSDLSSPWEHFIHKTLSLGVEDHWSMSDRWMLVGGASIDHLIKQTGENKTTVNPLVGVKFNPNEKTDLHLTFSQKSHFPSMKSLYSSTNGNPDLRDERGSNVELGGTWQGVVELTGAVFYNRIRDLIDVAIMPDGTKRNVNIGRARIAGFEIGATKTFTYLSCSLNYTYLDGEDLEKNEPLQMTPHSQFNAIVRVMPAKDWTVSGWAVAVSRNRVVISNDLVAVPGYLVANAEVAKRFRQVTLFARFENLLDKGYAPEAGYPMPARSFTGGIRMNFNFGGTH